MQRGIVAEFHKDSGGRLKLFSLTTLEEETSCYDGKTYLSRSGYDVDWSRTYESYLYHESSGGGEMVVEVSGIYFVSGDIQVKETPTTLVDSSDKPPWKGEKTLAIRKRNKTRRLARLPKSFDMSRASDLLEWLQQNGIEGDAVFCADCRDYVPGDQLCEHCWWCDDGGDYSTPTERLTPCKDEYCRCTKE